jgi:hypothetical protein
MLGSSGEIWSLLRDCLGRNIMVLYSVGPIITLHGQITAREYVDMLGNQVHPMVQTLFLNNGAVFQEDNAPIHTAGTVQLWFEEHDNELQHIPWPAQLPDLNISEPPLSVLETRVRKRFPPPTSLKQLDDILQEEWYKIQLETVQNFCESILGRIAAMLKAKGGPTLCHSVYFRQ